MLMKKCYIQPEVELVKAKGERLCQTFSITGGNDMGEEPTTGDNHFGAPFRFKY